MISEDTFRDPVTWVVETDTLCSFTCVLYILRDDGQIQPKHVVGDSGKYSVLEIVLALTVSLHDFGHFTLNKY